MWWECLCTTATGLSASDVLEAVKELTHCTSTECVDIPLHHPPGATQQSLAVVAMLAIAAAAVVWGAIPAQQAGTKSQGVASHRR